MPTRTLLAAASLLLASAASAAPVPAGLWSLSDGKAQVRISDCGGALCATLVGLKKPTDSAGRPKVDRHNPDPDKRDRPMLGVALVSGMTPEGDEWSGRLYNPDDGQTYAGRVIPDGEDRLLLKGCILGGVVCKTRVLTRLP